MEQNINHIVPEYRQAAEVIKTAILQGQYEALKSENRVQLAVYFGNCDYRNRQRTKINICRILMKNFY